LKWIHRVIYNQDKDCIFKHSHFTVLWKQNTIIPRFLCFINPKGRKQEQEGNNEKGINSQHGDNCLMMTTSKNIYTLTTKNGDKTGLVTAQKPS